MTNATDPNFRFLIADPDASRRARILAKLPAGVAIEAASMSEAFDLAEAERPSAIAISAEITGEAGLDMFLHLVDALSISFAVYGDRLRDQTPWHLKKSLVFVSFGPRDQPEKLFDALLGGETSGAGAKAMDRPARSDGRSPSLIVLGASTGGVSALETVLTAFPRDCPPTLVVQHIRAGFIDGMIKRLDGICQPRVQRADDGVRPERGHIYIAHDAERHLTLQTGDQPRCRLKADPPRHGHRPSVDALFETVAGQRGVAAALLTGMGADGAEGMANIKQKGGFTIAQDEATCVVYGMPRVAVERGAANLVLPLDRIAAALIQGPVAGGRGSRSTREMVR